VLVRFTPKSFLKRVALKLAAFAPDGEARESDRMPSKDDFRPEIIVMAEGRQGPQVKEITGPRGIAKDDRARLEDTLRTGSARAVAGVAIAAVATTNPVTAAVYVAYTVAKYAFPIVKAGVEEKMRTGDNDRAIEAMKERR
jgi:hypothetical protein